MLSQGYKIWTVGPCLQNETEEFARAFLADYAGFMEETPVLEHTGPYIYIETICGISLLYNWGRDYYFFAIDNQETLDIYNDIHVCKFGEPLKDYNNGTKTN